MLVYTPVMETSEAQKTTGQRIREERKARGLYQHELAARVKLSVQTIRNIEADRHDPRLSNLREIARALGVRAADLL